MTITTEELELLTVCDNEDMADIARELLAARKAVEAARRLEAANHAVCNGRTQAAYDQMISDGQADDLVDLDFARSKARAAITAYDQACGGEG